MNNGYRYACWDMEHTDEHGQPVTRYFRMKPWFDQTIDCWVCHPAEAIDEVKQGGKLDGIDGITGERVGG